MLVYDDLKLCEIFLMFLIIEHALTCKQLI